LFTYFCGHPVEEGYTQIPYEYSSIKTQFISAPLTNTSQQRTLNNIISHSKAIVPMFKEEHTARKSKISAKPNKQTNKVEQVYFRTHSEENYVLP